MILVMITGDTFDIWFLFPSVKLNHYLGFIKRQGIHAKSGIDAHDDSGMKKASDKKTLVQSGHFRNFRTNGKWSTNAHYRKVFVRNETIKNRRISRMLTYDEMD